MPDKYEVDLGDGNLVEIETDGPLTGADLEHIAKTLGAASRPGDAFYPASGVQTSPGGPTFRRGEVSGKPPFKIVSQWRQDGIKKPSGVGKSPSGSPMFNGELIDPGQLALAEMGQSLDGQSPQVKRWSASLARQAVLPVGAGFELADIAREAGSDFLAGRPVARVDGGAYPRLADMALGVIPFKNEGQALFEGGTPAAWDALKQDWEADPVGTLLQFAAARGMMKAPGLKSLNEGMKALETSADLSAPGRQGALLSINNPKAVPGALKDMMSATKSQSGLDVVAARAARPVGGSTSMPAPPLSSMVTVKPGAVPGGASLAPAPSQTPRAASPVSRSAMVEVKPGVYRMPSEVLDEALQTPTDARGALKRATAPDQLPAVQGPQSATITTQPLTGTFPDGTPRTKASGAAPVASSVKPEHFGLEIRPGNSEQFRGAWAKRIPLVGPMVAASERGFDGYLISIRRSAFDDAAAHLAKKGITPETQPQVYKDLATWVNRASGVGSTTISPVIADAMFAPKLTASRLELLNPLEYQKLDPNVRKLAIKQVLTATGAGLSVLALAAASGQDVSLDPESSDFGKVLLKDGKTRYEVFAGMTPWARLAALALTGSKKTGQQAGKRLESMLGPLPSLAVSAFRGSTFTGGDFDPLSETGRRFTPLVAQDMADAIRELGGVEGVLKASPALVGGGVQVYESKKPRPLKGLAGKIFPPFESKDRGFEPKKEVLR